MGLTFSPDGESVASGSTHGAVRIWNLSSGETRSLVGHKEGDVWSLAFSPDGETLVTAGHDHRIKIWDVSTGEVIRSLDEHSEAIVSVAYNADGALLASGSDDKTIKLWNTSDWSVTRTLTGGSECVYGVTFSPDGSLLVSGSRDKKVLGEILQYHFDYRGPANGVTLRIWDVDSGELLQSMNEHSDNVSSVAFSPDGEFIASASQDATVIVWRLLNGSDSRSRRSTPPRS